jgi:iron-sulfur cluster repair protein YtfE (RIC family)
MFLGSLEQVAQSIDQPLSAEARTGLETALRYFQEAAPKHTADEEESLFPRLRAVQDRDLQNILQQLALLEQDHRWADQVHGQADELGRRALEAGSLNHPEALRFRAAVNELRATYQQHIQFEDEVLFPLAARWLSADEKSAIAVEMAARRKIPFVKL